MPPRSAQKKLSTKTPAKSSPKPSVKPLEPENPPKPTETTTVSAIETPQKPDKSLKSDPLEETGIQASGNSAENVDSDSVVGTANMEESGSEVVAGEKRVVNITVETRVTEEIVEVKEIASENKGEENEPGDDEPEDNEAEGEVNEEEEGDGEEEDEEGEEGEEDEEEGEEEIQEVPEPVQEKRKQKEYEIFVGGLDRYAEEEDLKKVFEKVGEVVEVRLVKKAHSQRNKGFAFVRFATVEQAKRAASELKFPKVKGKVCGVTRNNDKETLHIRNICTTWTKDKLVEKLKPYELENLEEVHLIDDPINKGKNRGYAFLDFSTHMDAVSACIKLQKADVFFGTDVRAEVAFSKSAEPDEEVMSQVKSVFLDGLPTSWDEEQVREQFKKYGEIDNVQLARNMPTAKRKDFGFINFTTREAASACIEEVNKDGIGEGAQKVSVKATLRKPLQKRLPPAIGGWRGGYMSKSYGGRALGTRGIDRSYPSRPHGGRFGSLSRHSAREDEFNMAPIGKYGDRFRRDVLRREPAPAVSRVRSDLYMESRSSGRRDSYSRFPSRPRYSDDIYDPQFDLYDDRAAAAYDYPASSGIKRPYSALDDDDLVSSSLTRRGSRSGLEMDAYPQRNVSAYSEYSRILPSDRVGYERVGYPIEEYGSRYLAGRGASSRSYY
eukprot:TRINITY_DN8956_c0_g1_i2.p1 TRINITY_DN8956_c0_g1~~TRINITY_DN8956_c0_g1_i2.p1  ORF type:complete len:665 (+),score=148.07 TRINITY_DN8956_c0_g1_i2:233-2227(+)